MPAKKSAPSTATTGASPNVQTGAVRIQHAALAGMKGGKGFHRPQSVKSVHKKNVPANLKTTGLKKHRFRPGTVALRNIRKQQRRTDLLFSKAGFARVMRKQACELTTSSDFPNGVRMPLASHGLSSSG